MQYSTQLSLSSQRVSSGKHLLGHEGCSFALSSKEPIQITDLSPFNHETHGLVQKYALMDLK